MPRLFSEQSGRSTKTHAGTFVWTAEQLDRFCSQLTVHPTPPGRTAGQRFGLSRVMKTYNLTRNRKWEAFKAGREIHPKGPHQREDPPRLLPPPNMSCTNFSTFLTDSSWSIARAVFIELSKYDMTEEELLTVKMSDISLQGEYQKFWSAQGKPEDAGLYITFTLSVPGEEEPFYKHVPAVLKSHKKRKKTPLDQTSQSLEGPGTAMTEPDTDFRAEIEVSESSKDVESRIKSVEPAESSKAASDQGSRA